MAAVTAGKPYPCAPGAGQSIYGAFGDASAIGWQGNAQGVVACLGGSFYVQDGLNATYGYGIYNQTRTTWTNVDGYLPALVSAFRRNGVDISITNFGDELSLGGNAYVAVYSRVAIHNPTGHAFQLPAFVHNLRRSAPVPSTLRPAPSRSRQAPRTSPSGCFIRSETRTSNKQGPRARDVRASSDSRATRSGVLAPNGLRRAGAVEDPGPAELDDLPSG